MNSRNALLLVLLLWNVVERANCWPLDGYAETGIRRLEHARLVEAGDLKGSRQPAGALQLSDSVDIRLRGMQKFQLPAAEPGLQQRLVALLGDDADHYAVALLDLSDPEQPVYAEHRAGHRQNVGSVGKILAATGLFQALADTWPQNFSKRESVLRNTIVTADRFSLGDHHAVRLYDPATRTLLKRPLHIGDEGNLWEYLDWALSISSNAAAAMLMRESMLLRHYGSSYPVANEEAARFFQHTPTAARTQLFQRTFWEPITRNGMLLAEIRQGSFFTREGKLMVDGGGRSYATARSLMQLLVLMERGLLVDEWSSRRLKRLLYVTERRIRYASAPALRKSAVYFKSGSLYSCQAEEGFKCRAYAGNKLNYMNSIAIVESTTRVPRLHYIVTLISDVRRENSALAHQSMGNEIHKLMESRHLQPLAGTVGTSFTVP